MDQKELFTLKIKPYDAFLEEKIGGNFDTIAKPIDGLGDFEDAIARIGAMQGKELPGLDRIVNLVFCADNGIVEEGVTQTGQEVTKAVAGMLGKKAGTSSVFAEYAGVINKPVDVGIACDTQLEGVISRKIAHGTRNFLKEPAMTKEEALLAMETGLSLVKEEAKLGTDLITTGEMGIGNTTTATTLLCLLCKVRPVEVTGRGAGLSDEGFHKKLEVIEKAVLAGRSQHFTDERERALNLLVRFGGLDIAALAGTFIGGAVCGIPVIIDGLISATAAVIAEAIVPGTKAYLLASHAGRERGCRIALDQIGLKPFLLGDMALGEGTGALMLVPLLKMTLALYKKGLRFTDTGIDSYRRNP